MGEYGFAIVYHADYVAPLPDIHRFPMPKFKILRDLLLKDGVIIPEQIYQPELPDLELIQLVHTPKYVEAYCNGTLESKAQRRIGLPWSKALAHRTRIAIGGTILAAKLALEFGCACNTAGGTHHAFPGYGSGFCIFNDLAALLIFFKTTIVYSLSPCTAKLTFLGENNKAISIFLCPSVWTMMATCRS